MLASDYGSHEFCIRQNILNIIQWGSFKIIHCWDPRLTWLFNTTTHTVIPIPCVELSNWIECDIKLKHIMFQEITQPVELWWLPVVSEMGSGQHQGKLILTWVDYNERYCLPWPFQDNKTVLYVKILGGNCLAVEYCDYDRVIQKETRSLLP